MVDPGFVKREGQEFKCIAPGLKRSSARGGGGGGGGIQTHFPPENCVICIMGVGVPSTYQTDLRGEKGRRKKKEPKKGGKSAEKGRGGGGGWFAPPPIRSDKQTSSYPESQTDGPQEGCEWRLGLQQPAAGKKNTETKGTWVWLILCSAY